MEYRYYDHATGCNPAQQPSGDPRPTTLPSVAVTALSRGISRVTRTSLRPCACSPYRGRLKPCQSPAGTTPAGQCARSTVIRAATLAARWPVPWPVPGPGPSPAGDERSLLMQAPCHSLAPRDTHQHHAWYARAPATPTCSVPRPTCIIPATMHDSLPHRVMSMPGRDAGNVGISPATCKFHSKFHSKVPPRGLFVALGTKFAVTLLQFLLLTHS